MTDKKERESDKKNDADLRERERSFKTSQNHGNKKGKWYDSLMNCYP